HSAGGPLVRLTFRPCCFLNRATPLRQVFQEHEKQKRETVGGFSPSLLLLLAAAATAAAAAEATAAADSAAVVPELLVEVGRASGPRPLRQAVLGLRWQAAMASTANGQRKR
ncbi:unnamed protein product, partial [Laminaria digitata]